MIREVTRVLEYTRCIPRESGDDPDPPEVDQAIVGIPRESGDDPSPPKTYFARSMYSPRERG